MDDKPASKIWTEEERLALATKLDDELDEFIEGLEQKRYTEGWPEDRWQEEMEKHPFFMKKAPQPGDEVHPMFEGLQRLKYDPEENTAEELALNYKEDGNFYMKYKKFRAAIYSFTEGIKANCENLEVQAALYNNRSAAHFFLMNYRSALADAQKALEFKPDYAKARWRAAQCAFYTEKFKLCTELCEAIIENNEENTDNAIDLLQKNKDKKKEVKRNKRKEAFEINKRDLKFRLTMNLIMDRKIKFDGLGVSRRITEESLRPEFLPLEDCPVQVDDRNLKLIWPVAFSYPEFLLSDFQQQVSEETTMEECIQSLFAEPLPCDKDHKYKLETVNVYYEDRKIGKVFKADFAKRINEILAEPNFYVIGGALLFYIVPKDSRVEEEFIHEERQRPKIYT